MYTLLVLIVLFSSLMLAIIHSVRIIMHTRFKYCVRSSKVVLYISAIQMCMKEKRTK